MRCRSSTASTKDTDPAGSTRTAMVSSGPRSRPPAISPASTGANATVLSGPQTADGQHCTAGWTLYEIPGPNLKGHNRAIRLSLLQLGRPVQHAGPRPERTDRQRVGVGLAAGAVARHRRVGLLAGPYPLGFYARGLDAGSTILAPGGRAAACGQTTGRTSTGTPRAERGRRARWCASRSGRIRSLGSAESKNGGAGRQPTRCAGGSAPAPQPSRPACPSDSSRRASCCVESPHRPGVASSPPCRASGSAHPPTPRRCRPSRSGANAARHRSALGAT